MWRSLRWAELERCWGLGDSPSLRGDQGRKFRPRARALKAHSQPPTRPAEWVVEAEIHFRATFKTSFASLYRSTGVNSILWMNSHKRVTQLTRVL